VNNDLYVFVAMSIDICDKVLKLYEPRVLKITKHGITYYYFWAVKMKYLVSEPKETVTPKVACN
jgi:hypothetical protein